MQPAEADLEPPTPTFSFAETGGSSLIFVWIRRLTVRGHTGTAAFLLNLC